MSAPVALLRDGCGFFFPKRGARAARRVLRELGCDHWLPVRAQAAEAQASNEADRDGCQWRSGLGCASSSAGDAGKDHRKCGVH